ncbi:thioredoxin [Agromyces protaetiae]|uniref:Thioredoxin n=1 Tax=Agromyces protaetiae TaxID=2509455 RepID=A0A4V0YGY4_9MICO|nr:thioredoxin [Agromyces protaetiae]QAY72821.1 thioredoxin [Agromyces protaetiae]
MNDESPRYGLFRSLAHRLAGDDADLPYEGRIGSFEGATGWLNTEPLTAESLRGRVVLVDFWTYTCINWLRTAPYVKAWDAKYRDHGLTIVGVHTPEFGFESDHRNVEARTRALGVEYPVAIDDGYRVWESFANHYWPAVYLADAEGRIRFHHFGEGEYAMTEMAIQRLLVDAGAEAGSGPGAFDLDLVDVRPEGLEVAADWVHLGSPETYLGYGQSTGFAAEGRSPLDLPYEFSVPHLSLNEWGLSGTWTVARHAVGLDGPTGRIAFRFRGRDVNLVMGPRVPGAEVPFQVLLDGHLVDETRGSDLDANGRGVLRDQNVYQLVRQHGAITDRIVEVEFLEAGAEAYCFTFG